MQINGSPEFTSDKLCLGYLLHEMINIIIS